MLSLSLAAWERDVSDGDEMSPHPSPGPLQKNSSQSWSPVMLLTSSGLSGSLRAEAEKPSRAQGGQLELHDQICQMLHEVFRQSMTHLQTHVCSLNEVIQGFQRSNCVLFTWKTQKLTCSYKCFGHYPQLWGGWSELPVEWPDWPTLGLFIIYRYRDITDHWIHMAIMLYTSIL